MPGIQVRLDDLKSKLPPAGGERTADSAAPMSEPGVAPTTATPSPQRAAPQRNNSMQLNATDTGNSHVPDKMRNVRPPSPPTTNGARAESGVAKPVKRSNFSAAPWADPETTEQELRQYLAQQARYNRELEDAVLSLQAKLEQERLLTQDAESRLGFLMKSTQTRLELPTLVSDLENQIKLRDSVIACLQQEIAVMRGNKDKDLRDPSAGDALETHLSRAKARSQAIAEQYTKHYTQEAYNLRQKMSTAGTAPTPAV